MICYRSIIASGSSSDAKNYTATVNGNGELTSCAFLFVNQREFNESVIIGNNVKNCDHMFSGCWNFNSPVRFGKRVNNYSHMFSGCNNFNQPIQFSNYADACQGMFSGCTLFNQPVNIPEKATSCNYMFSGCLSFNQDVVIPNNVNFCQNMFASANASFNIYIKGDPWYKNFKGMLNNKNNQQRVNIFANSFDHLSWTNSDSVIGQYIYWDYSASPQHCLYNTAYNIYIYNNYVGT